ncbi:MAG TPA: peptidoglycan-associated lipoprotein Pal [Thermoanaerobaculia bacterium]|jgi:peptidoglycan-associated lipoprotein|nr:peptidoglycan-associated lipoprotein Pal [Thermoanaerobaculia bacterium]
MSHRVLTSLLCSCLLFAFNAGCRKRQPVTPPDVAPTIAVTPAPEPAEPAPAPETRPAAETDPFAGDLETVAAYARAQGLLGDVYFDYDQAELSAATRDRLAANARFFLAHPEFQIAIEGHCDERGTNEYNLALGDRRASSVKQYLGSFGVVADRLRTISYGEERPFCSESEESCWHENRRAHFVLSGRR